MSPDVGADSIHPDLVCNRQVASSVEIHGSDLSPMPAKVLEEPATLVLPSVTFAKSQDVAGAPLAGPKLSISGSPGEPNAERLSWQSSTHMAVAIDEQLALEPGLYDVTVTNPDGDKKVDLATALAVVDPPVIELLQPDSICTAQAAQAIVVHGTNLLTLGGEPPLVHVDKEGGGFSSDLVVQSVDGCTPIPNRNPAAELCTSATVAIPQGGLSPGRYVLTLESPAVEGAPGCASSQTFVVTVNPPPRVDAVAPQQLCSGGGVLNVDGEFFQQGARLEVRCGDAPVVPSIATSVTADGIHLVATLGAGAVPAVDCDVVVINPDGCEDEPVPHELVTGTDGPIVFYVDPVVAYNGINTRLTIYVSALVGSFEVSIQPTADPTAAPTALTSSVIAGTTNRIQAVLPEGQAAGDYDVIVSDTTGCSGRFSPVRVASELTLTVTAIDPPFGQSGQLVPVVIRGAGFAATPRAFLNPTSAAVSDSAIQLQGLSFVNQGEINAVVPTQAPAGTYDLVVVNPTGEVGLLQNAYQSLATGPPVITDVTPQSIVNGGGQTLTITGSGLASGSVSVDCKTLGGTDVADPTISAQSCSDTSCSVTLSAGNVPTGAVCVVTVTAADGSTFARFSAIGVTSSSLNLSNPSAGQPMITGRRALASAALRANSVSRFLYAAGGDGGQALAASPFASTELINVNLFGQMDPAGWRQNRESLRTPRAFMGAASIGRYFYVFGGTDGSQDLATGERAMLLAPEEAPKLADADLCLAGGTRSCFGIDGLGNGLEPGDYSYRVSALIDAADPVNLGGETLASDPIIFKLTTIGGRNLIVELTWIAPVDKLGVPLSGVIGYRIYRTPKDGVSGQDEVLLGEVSGATTQFIDDGTLVLGTEGPRPLGSTSAWQALPAMSIARRAPAGAAGRDPSDATSWYVYALEGTGLRSYEYLTVTLQPNERQSVAAAWTAGAQTASVERHEFGAWAVSSRNTALVSGSDTFVFLGGGRSTAGGSTAAVETGLIQAGGDLGVFNGAPKDMSPVRGGYAAFVVSSKLFVFGGATLLDGTPQPSAIAAEMSSPMPGLVNWNNEGITLTSPRNLLGSSLESAFIFLMGGEAVAGGPALQSTESLAF